MLKGLLFEPNPMEKDLSPCDLYKHKGVTEDLMFHVLEFVMAHHQL